MTNYKVSSRLDKLALWYDYTIVCDNIRSTIINHHTDEDSHEMCQWGLELTNPHEYTREDLLNKYDGKIRINKWAHTYTEDGKEAMAVVIERRKKNKDQ